MLRGGRGLDSRDAPAKRRVVTLEVVNERRRERDITLELGSFTSKGGSAVPVLGAIEGNKPSNWRLALNTLVTVVIEVGTERAAPP